MQQRPQQSLRDMPSTAGEQGARRAPLSRAEVAALGRALAEDCAAGGVRRLSVTQISRRYEVSQIDALRIFAQALCLGDQGRDIVFVDDGEYGPSAARSAASPAPGSILSRGERDFLLGLCREPRTCGA